MQRRNFTEEQSLDPITKAKSSTLYRVVDPFQLTWDSHCIKLAWWPPVLILPNQARPSWVGPNGWI